MKRQRIRKMEKKHENKITKDGRREMEKKDKQKKNTDKCIRSKMDQ